MFNIKNEMEMSLLKKGFESGFTIKLHWNGFCIFKKSIGNGFNIKYNGNGFTIKKALNISFK